MKISTEIASIAKIVGEERAVEYIARAGFDAWDFSMFDMYDYRWRTQELLKTDHPLAGKDYLKFAGRLRRIGLDCGIVCNQSHAPFPPLGRATVDYFKRSIECTAEAGAEMCVIHPHVDLSPAENAEAYHELLPFAKACGVKIAAENMWNWNDELAQAAPAACSSPESFTAHLDAVNDDCFVACLDIGHAQMRGVDTSAPEMIRALGRRLKALHIHDNDLHYDLHQLPFTMAIDFNEVLRALKEIGYNGYFTLEASEYPKSCGCTEENVRSAIEAMASAAKRMSDLFDLI